MCHIYEIYWLPKIPLCIAFCLTKQTQLVNTKLATVYDDVCSPQQSDRINANVCCDLIILCEHKNSQAGQVEVAPPGTLLLSR